MASSRKLGTARRQPGKAVAESFSLTVVIPVYNSADCLRECLQALLKNDLEATEILIVNDGSTDQTLSIGLEAQLEQPGSIRVLSNSVRQGPASSRNLGLQQARNNYIFFLDADVIIPSDALTKIRETLDLYSHRSEVAGVLGMYNEKIPTDDFWSNYKNLYTCFLYEMTDPLSPYLHTPMFCCRRDLLAQYGGFDERLAKGEDFKLGIQLGSRGYRFVIDRRIRGIHLKIYSFTEILREDWSRIQHLRRIRLDPVERKFSYRAHRLSRLLSVSLPLPAVTILTWGVVANRTYLILTGLMLVVLFFLSHVRFIRFCRRRRGLSFMLNSAGFLFVEMSWAQISLIWSFLRFSRDRQAANQLFI